MKHFRFFLILAVALAAATAVSAQNAAAVTPTGYELTFNIPENREAPVTGREVITFFLDMKQDVELVFNGQLTGVVLVNKKKAKTKEEEGRITLPKKRTRVGENRVELEFELRDNPFRRADNYIYTPYMEDRAPWLFPCMGSINQMNKFSLKLNLPQGWNSVHSETQEPIPANFVTFVAGRLQKKTTAHEGRNYTILYPDNAQDRDAQLNDMIGDAAHSITWLESYTGISYPFDGCNIVVLPSYKTDRLEHPGAILLNEKTALLRKGSTDEEARKRREMIAHEAAHLWFGDLVHATDDDLVLAHEVMTNYLTMLINSPKLAKVDQDIAFMRTYLHQVRQAEQTGYTHILGQELNHLEDVGLQYGEIVSDRATVMMHKLIEIIGEADFHKGVQNYLAEHAYGSATWEQFVEAMRNACPGKQPDQLLRSWLWKKGVPTIEAFYNSGKLIVRQDSDGWNQKLDIRLGYDMDPSKSLTIDMNARQVSIPIAKRPNYIIPNFTGQGFGRFKLTRDQAMTLCERTVVTRQPQMRYALLQLLFDNYLMGQSSPYYFGELVRTLEAEKVPFIISTICNHIGHLLRDHTLAERVRMEQSLLGVMQFSRIRECRQEVARLLGSNATCPDVVKALYNTWRNQSDRVLTPRDYMELSYRLALLKPAEWKSITETQASRLTDAALRSEYNFVSRACSPELSDQKALFQELLRQENRTNEAWVEAALTLLGTDNREPSNNYMITPGLEALEDIQLTSTASFPDIWLKALLAQHHSDEARKLVTDFIQSRPDYPVLLRNKVLDAASELLLQKK